MLIYVVLISKITFSQCGIDFEIKDTLKCKKQYFAIYTDTNRFNNTLTRTITMSLKKKKEFKVINIDSLKSYSLYIPTQNFTYQIISSNKYSYLLKERKEIYSGIKIKKIKIKEIKKSGLFTLYSVYSPNGFVNWRLSSERYNLGLSLNMLPYPYTEKCINIYSPLDK